MLSKSRYPCFVRKDAETPELGHCFMVDKIVLDKLDLIE
jgi:hypothetical protein